jgi:hypothetical protein
MLSETFIPMEDVLYRIKIHPDLTKKDKKEFAYITDMLKMTDKRKEKIFKQVKSNQQRNNERNDTNID